MAKKEKVLKLVENEIRIIECIKDYLNEYALRSNLIKDIALKDEEFDGAVRFVAEIDYGTFTQRIVYYPYMNLIDVEFSFEKSEYVYRFYDIFNLFDIDDFNLYYYEGLLAIADVESALKEILSATDEYFSYFEKAQTEKNLHQLEKNYEADMSGAYGSDDWKDEEDKDWLAMMTHPSNTFAGGQITPKMIKELRDLDSDNGLATIYEKRLLKHIEYDTNFTRKNLVDMEDFEKLYKRAFIKTLGISFLVPIVAAFALTYLIHAMVFSGALVLESHIKIGYFLATGAIYGGAIFLAFGKRIIAKFMPEELRERAIAKYEKGQDQDRRIPKKIDKPLTALACVAAVIFATFIFAENLADVGFYENSIKFMNMPFEFCEISYEDIEICKIQGYYNSNNEFIYNENTFAVYSGNKDCVLDDVDPDGETQKKLEEIAQKYNKEIKVFKTTEDFYENSGN